MNCIKKLHVFEYSTTHEFNPNLDRFPYGGPGFHTCLCGAEWLEPPVLVVEEMYIKEGTMIHDILSHKHLST